jgi:hypothetical protein
LGGQLTFAGTRRDGEVAPIAAVRQGELPRITRLPDQLFYDMINPERGWWLE